MAIFSIQFIHSYIYTVILAQGLRAEESTSYSDDLGYNVY